MNKKIIILAVIVECVLSVFLVSILGKSIEKYFGDIYATEIFFVNEQGERLVVKDETGSVVLDSIPQLEVNLSDSSISYQLKWVVISEKTTEKSVSFTSSKPEIVLVDEAGMVTFLKETDAVISIRTTDGSDKSASVTLIPKRDMTGDFE